MAVYTHLDTLAIELLLADYAVGDLHRFEGIASGVENSNFHLFTSSGRFVLTVFERRVRESDLPFFLGLVDHLSRKGVAVPTPIPRRDGELASRIADKPCVLSRFLHGRAQMTPDGAACRSAGGALGALHLASRDFALKRDNDFSLAGWRRIAEACGGDADRCAAGLSALIQDELKTLEARWPHDLPRGASHLDFFPDNVFFSGDAVSGIIDFYFSATDALAYDLAIGALAWSSDNGRLDRARLGAFVDGYRALQPLSDREAEALPLLLRGAAMRFLLTRLYDWLHQVSGALVAVKNPIEYRDLLLALRDRG